MLEQAKKVQSWKDRQARYKNMTYEQILEEIRLENKQEEKNYQEAEDYDARRARDQERKEKAELDMEEDHTEQISAKYVH